MSGRSKPAVGAAGGWLRRLATGLLLLAFGAFVLQGVAHAGGRAHAAHQDQAAGTSAGHCARPQASGGDRCGSEKAGLSLDCAQVCTAPAAQP